MRTSQRANMGRKEKNMDCFVDERDNKLIEQDPYTFFMLGKIMHGQCRVLLTDHERMILCHSEHPYPVWIWTPDNVTEKELEKTYQLTKIYFPFDEGFAFNMKYHLAKYFIKRAEEEGKKLAIRKNMFAYDCLELIPPKGDADGMHHLCTERDLEEIVEFYDLMTKETGIDKQSRDAYRLKAKEAIEQKTIYFWENEQGRHVASCLYRLNGKLASISLVYTRVEERRKHYAENLVYQVSKIAQEKGYVPMLYTDADYVASNACYEKIGYKLRGKLCIIAMEQ